MKPVAENVKFPEVELEVLQFWDDNKIFENTLKKTRDRQPFISYDGPPFATGLPHYGHLLAGTIKDIIPRFGPCVVAISTVALAGTATACRSKWKLSKP
jgi:isoleucyl-tRNA synthetase